jgi:hypothetical protein
MLLRASAATVISLILLVGTMAVWPDLHEFFHSDAHESGHECAVTVFAHGKVDLATVTVPVPTPAVLCTEIFFTATPVFSVTLEELPPGRGPPVSVSSLA